MVTTTKKYIIGLLTILIASGIYTVINYDAGVRIDISKLESKYYTYNNHTWVLLGTDTFVLYDQTNPLSPKSISISRSTLANNKTKILRTSKYANNASIVDTYLFDGNSKSVENFPVNHTVQIKNCKNCSYNYQYNVSLGKLNIIMSAPDVLQTRNVSWFVNGSRSISIRMFDDSNVVGDSMISGNFVIVSSKQKNTIVINDSLKKVLR